MSGDLLATSGEVPGGVLLDQGVCLPGVISLEGGLGSSADDVGGDTHGLAAEAVVESELVMGVLAHVDGLVLRLAGSGELTSDGVLLSLAQLEQEIWLLGIVTVEHLQWGLLVLLDLLLGEVEAHAEGCVIGLFPCGQLKSAFLGPGDKTNFLQLHWVITWLASVESAESVVGGLW